MTVTKATSSTAITSNLPNPSIRGQIVTVSYGVNPQFAGTPSGTVTVTASTGETCSAALSAGAGSCNLTFQSGGARTLTASYPGDGNFNASSSSAVPQTVSSVVLSTTSLTFGNQLVGPNSARQTVTVTNVGLTNLAMTSITFNGTNAGDFTQTNNCPLGGNLGAGRSCSINVTFRPTATGVRAATMNVNDVDLTSPQMVSLTGTGVQPVGGLSPTSHNFGTIPRRQTSPPYPFTLSNTGTAPMTINNISIGGANPGQFTIVSNSCGATLTIGGSCTITVTFSSRGPGNFTATLNVNDNAPNRPQSSTLTGTAQ